MDYFISIITSILLNSRMNSNKNEILTPIKSIRKKCLDCCNGQYNEIRNCTVINCALYPYRMGKRPKHKHLYSLALFARETSELSDDF